MYELVKEGRMSKFNLQIDNSCVLSYGLSNCNTFLSRRQVSKSTKPKFTGPYRSVVTVTSPSSNKQVSFSSKVQSKELYSQVKIVLFLFSICSTLLSGAKEVTNMGKV